MRSVDLNISRLVLNLSMFLVISAGCISALLGELFVLGDREKTSIEIFIVLLFSALTLGTSKPMTLAASAHGSRRLRLFGAPEWTLLAFGLAAVFSNVLSCISDENDGSSGSWKLFSLALYPLFCHFAARRWAINSCNVSAIDLGAVTIVFVCAVSIYLEALGLFSFESYGTRYFGFMGDPGPWLLVFGIVHLMLRKINAAVVVIGLIALLMTQSIGASAVFFFAFVGYLLVYKDRENNWWKAGLVSLILVSLLLAFEFSEIFLNRLEASDGVLEDRIKTNLYTLDVFLRSPMFGGGYGSHTAAFYSDAIFLETREFVTWSLPTSSHLQILSDFGLTAFVPWFLFIISIAKMSWRVLRLENSDTPKQTAGLALWSAAFLISNQSASWLIPGSALSILLFTCTGIVSGTVSSSQSIRRQPGKTTSA